MRTRYITQKDVGRIFAVYYNGKFHSYERPIWVGRNQYIFICHDPDHLPISETDHFRRVRKCRRKGWNIHFTMVEVNRLTTAILGLENKLSIREEDVLRLEELRHIMKAEERTTGEKP